MKKLLTKFGTTTFFLLNSTIASAADKVDEYNLLPELNSGNATNDGEPIKEVEALQALPKVTLEEGLITAIQTILTFSMAISLIVLVYMGVIYLQSMGKEEDLSKVKNMMIYLILGIAIMAAAYGVTLGIAQFDFFN